MFYLEDYLELIEHLPQELRDRFTDIREKDLQVQNSSGNLQERNELFFAEAKKLTPEQRQCEYEKLLKEYEKSLSYADEKVDIATNLCKIMDKLVHRLDDEIDKFRVELEASSSSICERAALIAGSDSIHMNGLSMTSTRASSVCSDTNGTFANGGHYENNLSSFGNNTSFKNSSSLHANHKSNLENISTNNLTSNNSINSALGATLTAAANKPNINSALAMMYAASVQNQKISGNTTLYNRNETKYCLCRQISYGEMVACDNNECEFEWFHYDCVNITRPPKGKWYCPNCLPKMDGESQNHQHQQQHLTSTTS